MPNQKLTKNLIFPEETPHLISEILRRYNLKEDPEEILEKFEKEKKINGEIVADFIKKVASEEISFQGLVSSLKTEFNLSQKKAEEMAKDLRKEILLLVEKSPEIPTTPIKETYPEEKIPSKRDVYREPIE